MMTSVTKYFISNEKGMYEVVKMVKEKNKPINNAWKEATGTDTIFKNDGYLYFCKKVKEAEILEETRFDDEKN